VTTIALPLAGMSPTLERDAPAFAPAPLSSEGHSMAATKFSAGERALVARGGFGLPSGAVQVLSALPRDAGPQQYRVRAEGESFERIIDEARLETISNDQQ
jgi:hypothetical protein